MRLVTKLTLALSLILVAQFSIYGFLAADRLLGFFEQDMDHDARQIGRTLAIAVSKTWDLRGSKEALAIISATNDGYSEYRMRFVSLSDSPALDERPEIPLDNSPELLNGDIVTFRNIQSIDGLKYLYTYVPIALDGSLSGGLEIRQSYAAESQFARISLIRVIAFFLVVLISTSTVIWLFGIFFIRRPLKALSEQAQRIGRGDFSRQLKFKWKGEIADLANEINSMSGELADSRIKLDEAMNAKITALEQMRHADRLSTIGTLASGIAHELGTPLTVIAGKLRSLRTDEVSAQALADVKALLSQQVDKMSAIIQQLLNYSRKRTPEKQICDLQVILIRVVELLRPFAKKRDLKLQFNPRADNVLADIDETQIEQVFTNLIINSIQASEEGEVEVAIATINCRNPADVEVEASPHHEVVVIDHGQGMSEAQVERIFDPFFTTKSPGAGTGMGLSIVDGIVSEHSGWINVESTLGKGTRFSVYIPACQGGD